MFLKSYYELLYIFLYEKNQLSLYKKNDLAGKLQIFGPNL